MQYQIDALAEYADDPLLFARWMNQEGFISLDDRRCKKCHSPLRLGYFTGCTDKVRMRCTKRSCNRHYSVREGSFFAYSNLPMLKQMKLIILFVNGLSVVTAASTAGVDPGTASIYLQKCREAYSWQISLEPIQYTANSEYEADEFQLQYVHDDEDRLYNIVWVAGSLERDTGKCMLYRVAGRSEKELIPPLVAAIPPGSFIYTDNLPTYHRLSSVEGPYDHRFVNHSQGEYVRDEDIGEDEPLHVHENTMESLNKYMRGKLKFYARHTFSMIDLMCKEVMYRRSGRDLFRPFKLT